jgi:hypothetical protein
MTASATPENYTTLTDVTRTAHLASPSWDPLSIASASYSTPRPARLVAVGGHDGEQWIMRSLA